MARTSKRQFELFKKTCEKYVERYGLKGWSIDYSHEKLTDKHFAGCDFDTGARWAKIALNTDVGIDEQITDRDVVDSAIHEVLELRFARLRSLAESRYVLKREIEEEIHNLIQTELYVLRDVEPILRPD